MAKVNFGFKIRNGLEGKFVEQSAPACMMVKGFKESVGPKGCLDNYDFYVAKDPNKKPKKVAENYAFGPGDYVSIVERK